MAKQTVNIGTSVNDGSGDPARTAFNKLNLNNNEIYNYLGDGTNLNKLGTAAFKNTGTQVGNVMQVGAFGLGGLAQTSSSLQSPIKGGGFYSWFNKETNDNTGVFSYQMALNIPWSDGTNAFQLIAGLNASKVFGFRRWGANDGYGNLQTIRTSENTTVDSNGFIKSASPIVELYADRIELNDEAQQQDIEFEKVGTGDYLIKGSTGFSQEGWYIETPKDANGNVLFSVIYTTLENGDISVKTYKKKFDFETASIMADLDNQVDITENRWINLRLQELPQPEIEVTDDPQQ